MKIPLTIKLQWFEYFHCRFRIHDGFLHTMTSPDSLKVNPIRGGAIQKSSLVYCKQADSNHLHLTPLAYLCTAGSMHL